LRQAITNANGDATATALAPHTITFNGAYTITLSSALPSLNNHVVVNATGNNVITINAFSGSSVLVVSSGRTVVLNYLTLQGATGVTNGGGITNNGTTTLNNCIIQNNAATNGGGIRTFGNLTCNNCSFSNNTGFGSAIYSASLGTITLEKCILQNNSGTGAALHVVLSGTATTIAGMATLNINNSIIKNNTNSSSSNTGGGVFAAATTSISNSEISGNSACRGGGITLGLGLTNTSTSTTYKTQLTIDKSTISGNSTNGLNLSALGGGIYIQGGSADLTANSSITNSTISGNSTSAIGGVVTTTAGGGINIGGGGTSAWVTTVTISNCTLTGNTVDGNSSASRGGALERVQGSVILNYSIAAGNNSNSSANNKDIHTNTTTIFGSTTGRNLLGAVGNGTTATGNSLFALSGSTVTTGNVLLTNAISTVLNTSLADNGGTTALPDGSYIKTHALVSGGSQTAINPTAAASGLQTVDQRGATRDATPDIGAFEYFAPTTWSGATDNTWATSTNWSNGVPTAFIDAIVNTGTPSITDSRTVANLTLGNAATITNTGTLNITNNLTNNGSILGGGTTILNGTIAQSISGTGTISNLTINNTYGVTIASGSNLLNITGVLTPTAGTLTTNGNLTLKSDATGTASIGNSAGTISGNVTVERYIPSSARRRYVLVGSPVAGASIYNAWQEGGVANAGYGTLITGGASGGSNGFDLPTTSAKSIFTYNDNNATGSKWVGLANTDATNLSAGAGYLLFVRGDRTLNITSTPSASGNTTLRATGTIGQGDISPTLSVTGAGKYNLIANPYPCAIDWNSGSITKTNLTGNFTVYDPNNNVFVSSNGSVKTPNIGNQQAGFIQSGQAFFVQNDAANGAITFTEAAKTTSATTTSSTTVFGEDANKAQLNINVYRTADNSFADGVVALFGNNYKTAVDANEDIYKFTNLNETFGLRRNNAVLGLEARPRVQSTDTMYFSLSNFAKKAYSLVIDGSNLSATTAKLEDKFTGTSTVIDVAGTTTYNFDVTDEAASSSNDRFLITFGSTAASTVVTDGTAASSLYVRMSPNPVRHQLQVSFKTATAEATNINVVNSLGQVIKTVNAGKVVVGNVSVPVSELASGVYTVQLVSGGKVVSTQQVVKAEN
jgi:hypothetical protein